MWLRNIFSQLCFAKLILPSTASVRANLTNQVESAEDISRRWPDIMSIVRIEGRIKYGYFLFILSCSHSRLAHSLKPVEMSPVQVLYTGATGYM